MDMVKYLVPIIIAHAAVLVVIIMVIRKMLLGDTVTAVSRIRQVEEEVRKKEEGIRKEIEEHEKDFVLKKAAAEEQLQQQRDKSEKEVGKIRDQVVGDAKKEAERIIEQAQKNEEKLRQQIAQDMEEKAVDYGGQVFKLVFSEKVSDALNRSFIDELLDALSEVDAGSITVDATQAEFVSSHPIAQDQRDRLQKLIEEKFAAKVVVQEKVKPELLAGIIFKLGSLEIDGSLLNRYQEAASEVKKTAFA